MTAKLIDGKAVAARCQAEIARAVAALAKPPGLAAVLVGDNPASATYVRMKRKRCEEVGIASWTHTLPASTTQQELLALVATLNAAPEVHGILVQMPLPRSIDPAAIMAAIDPGKDADGLHPTNLGRLVMGTPGPRPCTPHGVMLLLRETGVQLAGARAVVVGRSMLVGKPAALLLLEQNATVVLCHSRTRDLASEVGAADVLIAATGQPGLVRGEWVKPGAVVIDVGTTRLPDGRLCGDCEFETAAARASAITPVPGGVGPMTIAMLLRNTAAAAGARFAPASGL